ncbi:acyl-CoA carboxylase subunit epsilon [Streptomyces coerulescens]|uniref:Acyl-CoA carboxylase subunit epsilon n=1 Tax=Streptomyces coerulescens TaxID=29304 RepID=A0ABW0CKI3_STRCD
MSGTDTPEPPLEGPLGATLLKVIRGAPTAEELAVVTVLLTTLATAADDGPQPGSEPAAATWDRPVDRSPVSWPALR